MKLIGPPRLRLFTMQSWTVKDILKITIVCEFIISHNAYGVGEEALVWRQGRPQQQGRKTQLSQRLLEPRWRVSVLHNFGGLNMQFLVVKGDHLNLGCQVFPVKVSYDPPSMAWHL